MPLIIEYRLRKLLNLHNMQLDGHFKGICLRKDTISKVKRQTMDLWEKTLRMHSTGRNCVNKRIHKENLQIT